MTPFSCVAADGAEGGGAVGGSRGGGGGGVGGGRGGKRAEVSPDCFYTELISYSLSSPSLIRAPAAKRWSDFTSFSLGRPEETRCHCLLIFSRGYSWAADLSAAVVACAARCLLTFRN